MKVREILNRKVISIDSGKTALDAAKLTLDNDVHSIVVVNNRGVIGIVTEKDFLRCIAKEEVLPKDLKVDQIMSQPVITIDVDAVVEDAGALMSKHNIRRLPVLDGANFIGMITYRELAKLVTFMLMKSEPSPEMLAL